MEKCNFCQSPGMERPLDIPRACEEICPTGAIQTGSMAKLANMGREKAAKRLMGEDMSGFPSLMVGAHEKFGPDND
jgi:anaerobic dimethyl sulfoxide reductase subunit B (iron-sulfur subunit)